MLLKFASVIRESICSSRAASILKEDRGSSTIEFLGILPIVIIVLSVMWQMIVGVHGVVVAQSAVNEAAKVYSITEDALEASKAAENIVSTASGYLSLAGAPIEGTGDYDPKFTAKVNVDIRLVFLPEKLFGGTTPSVTYTTEATGRVIK
ncbi:TadE/TadG family type IV pilus assembly protein [Neobacillus piezotolerans]|uniref:TadE/TadG family type IV pilus assembly protein n=1 Tax=Neobacillus piezotolerans TaxID=2259171 RepID=UPI001FE590A3|nr:TadE family protein [Neobacillus piezotolerans]